MEIKTFVSGQTESFDENVNRALSNGFKVVELGPRQVGPDTWRLYAYMVKLDPPAEPKQMDPEDYVAALSVLEHVCKTAESCCESGCPLYPICSVEWTKNAPINWPHLEG